MMIKRLENSWKVLKKGRWGYFFLLPSLIPFSVFFILPLIRAVILSFSEVVPGHWNFVGITNYVGVFRDPVYWIAMKNTIIFAGVVVFGGLLIMLILSVLVFPLRVILQTLFKGAFYLPTVISIVVVTMMWTWLYNPAFGLLNYLLSLLNIEPVVWLGNVHIALAALIIMTLATGTGTGVILITASMGSISVELYDAARIDGAGNWTLFWKITMPLIRPVILYLLVISTIDCFQIFTPMWIMTRGGPQYATISVAFLVYRTAFQSFKLGSAAAQSIVLFFFILIISVIYFKLMGKEIEL